MLKIIRSNLAVSDEYTSEELLSKLLGCEVEILHNENGKPFLTDGTEFSLSDSGEMSVCVISENGTAIGIDIQKETERPMVARKFFSEAELKMPFSQVWARKEAYAKWLGEGLNKKNLRMDTAGLEFEEYHIGQYYIAVFGGRTK